MQKLSKYRIKKIIKDKQSGFLLGDISWKYDITLSRLVYLFEKQLRKNSNGKWVFK